MQSPVIVDLDGVPLRTSLHVLLSQLGLTYVVDGGLLAIASTEGDPPVPYWADFPAAHADPFLVVGHCLLALLAAALGGLLAPLVCGPRRQGKARASGLSGP